MAQVVKCLPSQRGGGTGWGGDDSSSIPRTHIKKLGVGVVVHSL